MGQFSHAFVNNSPEIFQDIFPKRIYDDAHGRLPYNDTHLPTSVNNLTPNDPFLTATQT